MAASPPGMVSTTPSASGRASASRSAATLRAMESAGPVAARAAGLRLAADLLAEARPLVDGVVLTMPEGDAATLGPLLAVVA